MIGSLGPGRSHPHLRLVRDDEQLQTGGGDGTSGGMEARINRLEQRIDKLSDDAGEAAKNLATLTERISHLPSKDYIDKRLIGLLSVIAALILFGEKIKTVFGI